MGYSRRKLLQLKMLYSKQLKKPIGEVIKLMPADFTDDIFVKEFRYCYGYLWQDLYKEHKFYQIKNKTFKGKKPLLFPTPYSFVIQTAFHKLKQARSGHWNNPLTETEKNDLRKRLIAENKAKLQKRNERVRKDTELLQNVVPNYANNMIRSYFSIRRNHPEDVSDRFYVLNEIAKFNNRNFTGFFMHVMQSEKNDFCRMFAFYTLQKWDKTVHLTKKRKGKKPYDKIVPKLPLSPDEQMELISKLQMERDKSYNVFLSHRSLERDVIIRIKDALNKCNLSVYVDWMIDKDGLPREKCNENTWATLEVRMLHCDSLLYVHTESCKKSEWIARELDFTKQNKIPMAVLNYDGSQEENETRDIVHFGFEDDKLFAITDNEDKESFEKWLKRIACN